MYKRQEKEEEKAKQEQDQGSAIRDTKQKEISSSTQYMTTPQSTVSTPKSGPEDQGVMSRVVISKPKWKI